MLEIVWPLFVKLKDSSYSGSPERFWTSPQCLVTLWQNAHCRQAAVVFSEAKGLFLAADDRWMCSVCGWSVYLKKHQRIGLSDHWLSTEKWGRRWLLIKIPICQATIKEPKNAGSSWLDSRSSTVTTWSKNRCSMFGQTSGKHDRWPRPDWN